MVMTLQGLYEYVKDYVVADDGASGPTMELMAERALFSWPIMFR